MNNTLSEHQKPMMNLLEDIENIKDRYNQAIYRLTDEKKELEKQLDTLTNIVDELDELEDYIDELNETIIRLIKGGKQ